MPDPDRARELSRRSSDPVAFVLAELGRRMRLEK